MTDQTTTIEAEDSGKPNRQHTSAPSFCSTAVMRVAYADPPYLGLAEAFYGRDHPEAAAFDDPAEHQKLIDRLSSEFDAWALSTHTKALKKILGMCPDDVRVMAWVKPHCSFKPGHKSAHFAWEPILVRGGRPFTERLHMVRDWFAAHATMKKGLVGAKPEELLFWLFEVLNLRPEDEFVDMFPGSGAVSRAWDSWRRQMRLPLAD